MDQHSIGQQGLDQHSLEHEHNMFVKEDDHAGVQPSTGVNAHVEGATATARPGVTYPPALATHEQVLLSRDLFFQTLRQLHTELGATLKIPNVCSRELDLHLLYSQVTSFGGLESVIRHKKWPEVAAPFQFPPTFTSKSFTLRKFYTKLLHDYEQVYFFRNTGTAVPPPGSEGTGEAVAVGAALPAAKRKREDDMAAPAARPAAPVSSYRPAAQVGYFATPPAGPPSLTAFTVGTIPVEAGPVVGAEITGRIDAKFDCGYFVTITASGYEFKGVLYSPPAGFIEQQMAQHPVAHANAEVSQQAYAQRPAPPPPASQAAKEMAARKPKQNKTPYNYFSADVRERAKELYPTATNKEISKIVGEMWQAATPEQRAPYIAKAEQDKERFQGEMRHYEAQEQQRAQASAAADQMMAQQPGYGAAATPPSSTWQHYDYQNAGSYQTDPAGEAGQAGDRAGHAGEGGDGMGMQAMMRDSEAAQGHGGGADARAEFEANGEYDDVEGDEEFVNASG